MPREFLPQFQFERVHRSDRGYLPHWQAEEAIYSVTFRLADSLPASVAESLNRKRHATIRALTRGQRELTTREKLEVRAWFEEQVDEHLDRGYGACVLRSPECAKMMGAALTYFDHERVELFAWCVMPNHVHVVFRLLEGQSLDRLLHSWKSFTSHELNRLLGLEGTRWQPEYFDRIIRDENDLHDTIAYVLNNPAAAGLKDWPWVWSRWAE